MYTDIVTTITQRIEIADGGMEPLGVDIHIDPGDLIAALGDDQIKQVVAEGLKVAVRYMTEEVDPEDGH